VLKLFLIWDQSLKIIVTCTFRRILSSSIALIRFMQTLMSTVGTLADALKALPRESKTGAQLTDTALWLFWAI
jgi:hypothetical protein